MKIIVDGKEYDAEPVISPYENPNNPKYVVVNGSVIPIDTIGIHRPIPKGPDKSSIPKPVFK